MKLVCPLHAQAVAVPADKVPACLPGGLARCPECGCEFQADYTPPAYDTTYYAGAEYHAVRQREDARKAARLWRLIAAAAPRPGRWLEIGPGLGLLTAHARRAGWQTGVVEPVAALHPHYTGSVIHAAPFETAALTPGIDCLVMADVIEHFTDPLAMLQRAASLAAPGGILVIETPNRASSWARLAGSGWAGYSPFHAFFFTPACLGGLLARSDWHLHQQLTSPPDLCSLDALWRSGLQGRLRARVQRDGGPPGRGLRNRLLQAPLYWGAVDALNVIPNLLLRPLWQGDQLYLIARKTAA